MVFWCIYVWEYHFHLNLHFVSLLNVCEVPLFLGLATTVLHQAVAWTRLLNQQGSMMIKLKFAYLVDNTTWLGKVMWSTQNLPQSPSYYQREWKNKATRKEKWWRICEWRNCWRLWSKWVHSPSHRVHCPLLQLAACRWRRSWLWRRRSNLEAETSGTVDRGLVAR